MKPRSFGETPRCRPRGHQPTKREAIGQTSSRLGGVSLNGYFVDKAISLDSAKISLSRVGHFK